MWVITFAVNEYNQQGHYIDRVFDHKPTKEELKKFGYDSEHLLNGGGRKGHEHKWFYLTEIKSGQRYKH